MSSWTAQLGKTHLIVFEAIFGCLTSQSLNTDFSAWDYLLPLHCFTDGLTTIIVAISGLGVGARGVDNVVCSGSCERDLLPRILWGTGVLFPWGASYRVDKFEGFTRPSSGPCVRSPLQRKHESAIFKSGIGGIAEYHCTITLRLC